jgi:hypothetical protein
MLRLIGGKGGRDRAITPGQPALAGLVKRPRGDVYTETAISIKADGCLE